VEEVAVAEPGVSREGEAAVSVLTGASVAGAALVARGASVAAIVAVDVSPAAPPPQADKTSIISAATTNSFLIIFSLLSNHVQKNAMLVPKTTPGESTKKTQKNFCVHRPEGFSRLRWARNVNLICTACRCMCRDVFPA
jgi:hypothetical protein